MGVIPVCLPLFAPSQRKISRVRLVTIWTRGDRTEHALGERLEVFGSNACWTGFVCCLFNLFNHCSIERCNPISKSELPVAKVSRRSNRNRWLSNQIDECNLWRIHTRRHLALNTSAFFAEFQYQERQRPFC